MGRINIPINDKLDKRLRSYIGKQGYKRGAMKEALEEALEEWLKKRGG